MKELSIIICDDSRVEATHISSLLSNYSKKEGVNFKTHIFYNPVEMLEEIDKGLHTDIIFLDILLPGMLGIEAAKELRSKDKNVTIFFISSSPEYAVDSYSVNAYYYLLKPVDEGKLDALLQKVTSEILSRDDDNIVIKTKNGITRIILSKLIYVEVIGKKLFFNMADGSQEEAVGAIQNLSETLCAKPCFIQPHRSFIVNMDYISTISAKNGIILINSDTIPIPRGKFTNVKDSFLEYSFSNMVAL